MSDFVFFLLHFSTPLGTSIYLLRSRSLPWQPLSTSILCIYLDVTPLARSRKAELAVVLRFCARVTAVYLPRWMYALQLISTK